MFTITVDAGEAVFLRGDAAGYHAAQRGVIAPVAGVTGFEINMPSDTQVAGIGGALGVTLDPAKGIVGVDFAGAFTSTQGGFTVTLSAATDGAFTFDSAGNPVLTSTTLPGGQNTLIFYNVDAGTTTVVANPPGAIACTSQSGITNELVSADTITNVNFDCQ